MMIIRKNTSNKNQEAGFQEVEIPQKNISAKLSQFDLHKATALRPDRSNLT
jgi:hypothetical protein